MRTIRDRLRRKRAREAVNHYGYQCLINDTWTRIVKTSEREAVQVYEDLKSVDNVLAARTLRRPTSRHCQRRWRPLLSWRRDDQGRVTYDPT